MRHRKDTFLRDNDRSWRNHQSKEADRKKRHRDQRERSIGSRGYRD
jgi:hypothetical protein